MRRLNPALLAGGAITAALVAVALAAAAGFTPLPPARVRVGLRLRPPLEAGLLGTDPFGRDVLSLVMAGAANSLAVVVPAVLAGALVGGLVGLAAAGARGSLADRLAMRVADILFAVPAVLSAILVAALIGGGPTAAVLALALFNAPVFARVARGLALEVIARDHVAAARALGRGPLAILLGEVLPNVGGALAVQLALQLGLGLLTEAGLSYLGLGVRPPAPSWGRMLADAGTYLADAPHLAWAPGLALALAVLGLNLLGDGLRDALDPRLAARAGRTDAPWRDDR